MSIRLNWWYRFHLALRCNQHKMWIYYQHKIRQYVDVIRFFTHFKLTQSDTVLVTVKFKIYKRDRNNLKKHKYVDIVLGTDRSILRISNHLS